MERKARLQGILHISQRSPPSRFPSRNPSQRDAPPLEPSFIHISKSLVYDTPLPHQVPLGWKGAPLNKGLLTWEIRCFRTLCRRKECVMRDAVMCTCPLHAHEVYNNLG
jgi:hypothetical protein